MRVASTLYLSLLPFIVSCSMQDTSCHKSELNAVAAVALGQANDLSAVQSTLEALQRRDAEVAKNTLEQQLKADLTTLYAIRAQVSGDNLTIVNEAIANAERYADENKLVIIKPNH